MRPLRSASTAMARFVMGWTPSLSSRKVVVKNYYQNSKNRGSIFENQNSVNINRVISIYFHLSEFHPGEFDLHLQSYDSQG